MNSNANIMSDNMSIINNEVKNKGFLILDTMFKQHGWHIVKNEMNWISYTKFSRETDIFDIKIDKKAIHVSIPVKNSPYQYITSFTDYFQASEYIEARFYDFIK
jgi:hypothetical protein